MQIFPVCNVKRRRLIIALVAGVILGCLSGVFFREREPRYQGRTLTEWIEYSENDPNGYQVTSEWIRDGKLGGAAAHSQAASHALKQMASEAIPLLLKWVQVKPSPIESTVAGWLEKVPGLHPQFHSLVAQGKAFDGFYMLGNDGRPAWPKLIALTYDKDPERRYWAFNCLVYSRPDKETLEPVLLRLIHDPDYTIRQFAAWAFHDGYPEDAEKAGVYKVFPSLKREETHTILGDPTTVK